MAHSSLATVSVPANTQNYTAGREKPIRCITIHHMAGVMSASECGNVFASPRSASAHYGVGNDGSVGVYVEEENTAWANANWASNSESIAIEVSNSIRGGEWPVGDTAYNKTIELVADIAKRNNLGTLVAGQNLTWHSMFSATTCPGDYLRARIADIANKANKINELAESDTKLDPTPPKVDAPTIESNQEVAMEVIRGRWGNGEDRKKRLLDAGYNYDIIQILVNDIMTGKASTGKSLADIADEVIAGEWGNGDERKQKLTKAGYDYNAVQNVVNVKLGASSAPKVATAGVQVGDRVTLTNYEDYNGIGLAKTRDFYYVSELNGDRAVLVADNQHGPVYAAVNVKNLREF